MRTNTAASTRVKDGSTTVLSVDEVREYARASELPLTDAEAEAVQALWSRNFDHTDRYVMPLKSSV